MPLFMNTDKVLGSGTYGKVYAGTIKTNVSEFANPVAIKLCREGAIDTSSAEEASLEPPFQWSQNLQPILREINALYALNPENGSDETDESSNHRESDSQCHTVHLQQVIDRRRRLGPGIQAQGWDKQFIANLVVNQVGLPHFSSCLRLDGVLVAMDQMFCSLYHVLYEQPAPVLASILQMDRARAWIRQLYSGIQKIHQEGLVHRDIKPQNLLLSQDAMTLKIADFGLAHIKMVEPIDDQHVRYVEEIGTPQMVTLWYRPPEILNDSVEIYSASVDLWSCACIVAEIFRTLDVLTCTGRNTGHPNMPILQQTLFRVDICQNPHLSEEELQKEDIKNMLERIQFVFQNNNTNNVFGLSSEFQTKWPRAMEFIQWILQLEPQKRPSSRSILQHGFLNSE